MAKFRKLIVTPAAHKVSRVDGSKQAVAITKDKLKTWVENTKKLIALGFSIPNPLAHQDKNKKFPLPRYVGTDGAATYEAPGFSPENSEWDETINAGNWEAFDLDAETGGLLGVASVPGELKDKDSLAGRMTSIKEASVMVIPKATVKKTAADGTVTTHEIGEHITHVASCLTARSTNPDQPNFEPISNEPALAMSMILAMSDMIGSPIDELLRPRDQELDELRQLMAAPGVGIALPESTTRETLVKDLILILTQKIVDQQQQQEEMMGMGQQPQGSQVRNPSIAMSTVTPAPVQPSSEPSALDKRLALLMSNLGGEKKTSLKDRIKKLIATGRCGKDYADKNLLPQVESFVMGEMDDAGNFAKQPIEVVIEALESAQPLAMGSLLEDPQGLTDAPEGYDVQEPPAELFAGENAALSDEQMDTLLDEARI